MMKCTLTTRRPSVAFMLSINYDIAILVLLDNSYNIECHIQYAI